MRYCEALVQSSGSGINTVHFCDWNGQIYSDPLQCFSECSSLLISRSDAQFIILLTLSLFVLFLVVVLAKAVLE